MCAEVLHYLSKKVGKFFRVIMHANCFQRSDVLLYDRLVLNLLENGVHDILSNPVFVAFIEQDEVGPTGNVIGMLKVSELPMDFDKSSKLNGGCMVDVDLVLTFE